MFGLAMLLITAALLLIVVLTIVMTYEATHPPRRTAAYAIARSLPSDPGEMDLPFDAWTLDRPDGAQLPVWDIQGRSIAAPRTTVVFVHGWGHSRIDSLTRIEPWLAWCHRVVLYDLRGHGDANSHSSTLGHGEVDDLLDLLDTVRSAHDDRIILVGHSMGAVIAIAAAAADSDVRNAIAGVIAYGPYQNFHSSLRARLRLHSYPARPMTDLMLLWLTLRKRPPRNLTDEPAGVRCPMLIVRGTADVVSPLDETQQIVNAAPDALLREIDGAAHSDPELFHSPDHLQELERFVQRVTGS